MPKAYFLGTSGWYDSGTGNTVCTVLEYPEFNIILDAGGGFAKLDRYIDLEKPAYLFLSHLHLDHISGLHTLPKYAFRHDLHILLAKGSVNALKVFMDFPYTAPASTFKKRMNYGIRITALPARSIELPFRLSTLPMVHSVETTGARIEAAGKVVSYVMDTGYCENAVELSRNADLLIAECTHRPGEKNPEWPHLAPEEAARVALMASCKKLVLTHFDANRYPTMASREASGRIARKTFKNTTSGCDGFMCGF
ncbi:MAG: MBL fold metallo-hydrolase [Myxococcota bacterium]|jgi:ribonuclease BN (tRNA processing enzyme)